MYALSIKQPWAALLVHGVKTIEIRRWNTKRRGPILIHAARVPDLRPEGWKLVTSELADVARLQGGVLGIGRLREVRAYRSADTFRAECNLHRNDPEWFEPTVMYGLIFDCLTPLPFLRVSGNVKFFTVEAIDLELLPANLRPEGGNG